MAGEIQEAKKWVVNLLKADSTMQTYLGSSPTLVFADRASKELGFPRIIINTMSAVDVEGLGVNRVLTKLTLQIRVISEGPPNDTAKNAEHRMDQIMQTQVTQVSGGYNFSVRRISPIDRVEYDESAKPYHTLGGLYRVTMFAV